MAAWSLSARRAWIEIHTILGGYYNVAVALRKESVDRNRPPKRNRPSAVVALRKESVDRNTTLPVFYAFSKIVALRKESVDRNVYGS